MKQLGFIAGVGILAASAAFMPAEALDAFAPPKRFIWAALLLCLAIGWQPAANHPSRARRAALASCGALLLWMALRTLLRPRPLAELEVLSSWSLPVCLFIVVSSMKCDCAAGRATGRATNRVCRFLLFAGAAQAALMCLQRFGLDPLFGATTRHIAYAPARMIGTVGYQNQAAEFLALSLSGVFMLRGAAWRGKLAVIAALYAVIALTGNRGAFFGLNCALLAAAAMSMRAWRLSSARRIGWRSSVAPAFLACALLAGALAFVPELRTRFLEVFDSGENSVAVSSRLWMWKVGAAMFAERPVFGWGAGEYAFQYLDRLGGLLPAGKSHALLRSLAYARESHNDALQFAAEFGALGSALLLVAAVALIAAIARSTRRAAAANGAAAAAVFILVFMAVTSSFSFTWQTGLAGPLAGLLLGFCMREIWRDAALAEKPPASASSAASARPCDFLAKSILIACALAIFSWNSLDAFLNHALPARASGGRGVRHAEKITPSFAHKYIAALGAHAALQKSYAEAERLFTHSRQGFHDLMTLNNLGNILSSQNKWDDAVSVYEEWARCGIMHEQALHNLSLAYENAGRLAEAEESAARWCVLWTPPPLPRVKRLVVLQLKLGKGESAHRTVWRHHRLWRDSDPATIAEMYNMSGAACIMTRDYERAREHLLLALRYNPDLRSAQLNLEMLNKREVAPEKMINDNMPRQGRAAAD